MLSRFSLTGRAISRYPPMMPSFLLGALPYDINYLYDQGCV